MRLRERIARLEGARGSSQAMSREEIDAAATVFEGKLATLDRADPVETAARMAQWRAMVEAAGAPLQRVIAGLDPADFDL